ncbi:MAG TPA: hypothetical protein V6D48_22210 [Oculatellaceae cyanobacterium]
MGSQFSNDNFDHQEAHKYRPGQRVELKASPGQVDVITEYDPMMVPPIWLANDPKPRYPHELNLLGKPVISMSWLSLPKRRSTRHPVPQSSAHLVTSSH